eukprot:6209617-Pleurochrysis_carterae.AAC.5
MQAGESPLRVEAAQRPLAPANTEKVAKGWVPQAQTIKRVHDNRTHAASQQIAAVVEERSEGAKR